MLARLLARVAALPLAISIAAVSAPSASADTRSFHDAEGETGSSADITTVKVTNGSKRVTVSARTGEITLNSVYTFWIDTKPKNAGPEYKAIIYPNSDGIFLKKVGSFSDRGRSVRCPEMTALADAFGSDLVKISVPRSCLKKPGKVRATIRSKQIVDGKTVTDWAPGKNKFFGWVER